jgi:hypothetical protein
LIQAPNPRKVARSDVEQLGFEVTDDIPKMIRLHGDHVNLFIQPGPPLGPVIEVTVDHLPKGKERLVRTEGVIVKDEPDVPRCCVRDPQGWTYNLTIYTGRD